VKLSLLFVVRHRRRLHAVRQQRRRRLSGLRLIRLDVRPAAEVADLEVQTGDDLRREEEHELRESGQLFPVALLHPVQLGQRLAALLPELPDSVVLNIGAHVQVRLERVGDVKEVAHVSSRDLGILKRKSWIQTFNYL